MTREALQLVPYAVIAAFSPLAVAATLVVMETGRFRALCFAVGLIVGQIVTCAGLVAAGAVAVPDRSRAHESFQAVLALTVGVTLIVLAVILWRRPEPVAPAANTRSQAALQRLKQMPAPTTAAAGFALGVGGPKRLVLTALAAASITAAGLRGSSDALLTGWYGLLATISVWGPVLAYLVLGRRVVTRLDQGLAWLSPRRRSVTVLALIVVGATLVADAVIALS